MRQAFEGWWVVLQCPPQLTRFLRDQLVLEGYDLWLPEYQEMSRPKHARRPRPQWRLALPGYLFVPEAEAMEVAAWQAETFARRFRVMQLGGKVVKVEGESLKIFDEMLEAAGQVKPLEQEWLPPGTKVQIRAGPFETTPGVIALREGNYQVVIVGKWGLKVKVPPFLLERIDSYRGE